MIIYAENTKRSIIKQLELINKFTNVTGYKINTIVFLYICKEQSKNEIIKKKILSMTSKIRYTEKLRIYYKCKYNIYNINIIWHNYNKNKNKNIK